MQDIQKKDQSITQPQKKKAQITNNDYHNLKGVRKKVQAL